MALARSDGLLDYEVFEALKVRLSRSSDQSDFNFLEAILGYGFRASDHKEPAAAFILLCRPQSKNAIQNALSQALPDGVLQIDSINLAVEVLDSTSDYDLQHVLPNLAGEDTSIHQDDLADWVQVSLGQTLRQVVLQDHRKVILPTYLLRYTPFTSPNLVILRAALSQIHFLHQTSSSNGDDFEQRSVSARMSEITRWSSFSRTTIYRFLHEDPRSQWLIEVENKGAYQNDQGQQISLPNQYVLQPLRLTPGDATDLANYLKIHFSEAADLDDCLVALAKIDRREIMDYPYRVPQDGDRKEPASVLQIFQEHFNGFELNPERLTLLDKVRDNLIGDDFVAVPWYVLRELLPVYGASIITLYLMCQPLLYRNGGVRRDTFWLPGGEQTLTAWTNDRSISKYFPKSNAKGRGRPASRQGCSDTEWRKSKREALSDFFLRVDVRKDDNGAPSWQVLVHDHPVLPRDEQRMKSIYQTLAALWQNDQLEVLLSLFEKIPSSRPQNQSAQILDQIYRLPLTIEETETLSITASVLFSDLETPDNVVISEFDTPADRLISILETSVSALISKSATPETLFISELETHLKILYRIKDSIKVLKTSTFLPDSQTNAPKPLDLRLEGWDLKTLLQDINPDYQTQILEHPNISKSFIGWIIQNALNPRVNHPLNLAITQTLQNQAVPEPAAGRLSELPAHELRELLLTLRDHPESLTFQSNPKNRAHASDIKLLMMGQSHQEQQLLIQRLIDLLQKGA